MSKHFELRGPAGALEALLDTPGTHGAPLPGAVVAHPHPLRGGTMHNTNVFRTAKALAAVGFEVLRFNFRGVGSSAGKHDEGPGERDDVRAALDALDARGCSPLVGVGYSFGGAQMLQVAMDDARVCGIATMGLPVRIYSLDFARNCKKPLLVVQGTEDVFGSPDDVRMFFRDMPNVTVVAVEGSGHFFERRAADVGNVIAQFALKLARKHISN